MPKGEVLCTHFDEEDAYQKGNKHADSQVYKCSATKATLSLCLKLIFLTVKVTDN